MKTSEEDFLTKIVIINIVEFVYEVVHQVNMIA